MLVILVNIDPAVVIWRESKYNVIKAVQKRGDEALLAGCNLAIMSWSKSRKGISYWFW